MKSKISRFALLFPVVLLAFSSLSLGQAAQLASSGNTPNPDLVSASLSALRGLNMRGVTFQGQVVYDWSKTLSDGEDSDAGYGRYSFDLSMPVDGKKLFGWKGSAGLVRLKHHMNHFGETYDDEAQVFSNIDAPSRTTLYEIWFEQRLLSDRVRLKAGKIDANTEFAAVQNAGDFLNSSMGYSPTIMAFPTYPEPKLGVSAFLHSARNCGLGLGVFQTAGMGTLSIVEPGHTWNLGRTERPGRVSFGYWRLDGRVTRFDGDEASGTQGLYSVLEQSVWRQPLGQKGERKLLTFLQAGWASGDVSSFTRHLGGGAVLQAPFRKRSQDGVGLAATWVHFSPDPDADFDLRAELTLEAYYKISLINHISLVSDFQYLHHPGGLRANRDCPVMTPRLVVSF